MKKTIIIMFILNILCAIWNIFFMTKDDRVTYENVKEVSSALAIMVYDETIADYVKQDTVPTGEYVVNAEKTHCVANGEIKAYDNTKGTITYSLSSGDECYIYFDVGSSESSSSGVLAYEVLSDLEDTLHSAADGDWAFRTENGIRYQGYNPYNYVCFDESCSYGNYRIVGIFEETYDGDGDGVAETTDNLIKLIDITPLDAKMYWTDSQAEGYNLNNWEKASLNNYLNTTYYEGLNVSVKNKIVSATWHLGGPLKSATNVGDYYTAERSDTVYSGNPTSVVRNVGLIYPSDFGYGVISNFCNRTITMDVYGENENCFRYNWLYFGTAYWSITPRADSATNALYLGSYVTIGAANAYANNIYPSFYLSPKTRIVSGNGYPDNPYILSL